MFICVCIQFEHKQTVFDRRKLYIRMVEQRRKQIHKLLRRISYSIQ